MISIDVEEKLDDLIESQLSSFFGVVRASTAKDLAHQIKNTAVEALQLRDKAESRAAGEREVSKHAYEQARALEQELSKYTTKEAEHATLGEQLKIAEDAKDAQKEKVKHLMRQSAEIRTAVKELRTEYTSLADELRTPGLSDFDKELISWQMAALEDESSGFISDEKSTTMDRIREDRLSRLYQRISIKLRGELEDKTPQFGAFKATIAKYATAQPNEEDRKYMRHVSERAEEIRKAVEKADANRDANISGINKNAYNTDSE